MSLLILARHGQAPAQSYVSGERPGGEVGLSSVGRQQAAALGAALRRRGIQPDIVLSGGLARQDETAQICLQAMGSSTGISEPHIEPDPRWREYDVQRVLGNYPGRDPIDQATVNDATANPRDFQQLLDGSLRSWMLDQDPPDGLATWSTFAEGVCGAMREASERAGSGKTVLVFTSGGPIAVAATHLLGVSGPDPLLALHRVVVNGSITKVIGGSRGLHLSTFNEHGHLESTTGRSVTYR